MKGTQGLSFPLEPCRVQCHTQSGAVHIDSMNWACLGRVRLTKTLFVVASVPVMWVELQVSITCQFWFHNNPWLICCSDILGMISLVFCSQCEHTECTEGKRILKRKREYEKYLISLSLSFTLSFFFFFISSRHRNRDGGYQVKEGYRLKSVGGYSLGVWIYVECSHQDVMDRDYRCF